MLFFCKACGSMRENNLVLITFEQSMECNRQLMIRCTIMPFLLQRWKKVRWWLQPTFLVALVYLFVRDLLSERQCQHFKELENEEGGGLPLTSGKSEKCACIVCNMYIGVLEASLIYLEILTYVYLALKYQPWCKLQLVYGEKSPHKVLLYLLDI
jgi:hypothetical protein